MALGLAVLVLMAKPLHRDQVQIITLVAGGDVMLASGVGNMIAQHGPDYPFEKIRPLLFSADITFCNLECAISTRGHPVEKQFRFRARPEAVHGLTFAGVDVVSLANNHSLDYGPAALGDTLEILDQQGIIYVGAGRNRQQAEQLKILERKGLKVGFLAFAGFISEGFALIPGKPQIAVARDRLAEIVARARLSVDVLIVSFHWGRELTTVPSEQQRRLAHTAVEAGADLVIGHHPHEVQPLVGYRRSFIAYSLGDFVFNPRLFGERKGAVLKCRLSKRGIERAELLSIAIENCQPRCKHAPAIQPAPEIP